MKSSKPVAVEVRPDEQAGLGSIPKAMKTRLSDVENLTKAILWVGIATIVAVLITSSALVLDQMHFNNQTYHDQSSTTKIQDLSIQVNKLSEQVEQLQKTK